MSGSLESLSLRLQAGTSERRPHSDYYSYSVYARLFGRIQIPYSAYYSDQIEYSVQLYLQLHRFAMGLDPLICPPVVTIILSEFATAPYNLGSDASYNKNNVSSADEVGALCQTSATVGEMARWPATELDSLLQETQRHVKLADGMKYQTNVALIMFTTHTPSTLLTQLYDTIR